MQYAYVTTYECLHYWQFLEKKNKKTRRYIILTQLGLHMTQIEKITNKYINISKEFKATR